jgi:hypothetical protein
VSEALVATAAERRQSRIDKIFPSRAGGSRELALLRRAFGPPASSTASQQEFRKTWGTREIRTQFDTDIGAITSTESYVNGVLEARTRRAYDLSKGQPTLKSTSTEFFDASGASAGHVEHTMSNLVVH